MKLFLLRSKLINTVKIETSAKYNDETVCTDLDVHYLEAMLREAYPWKDTLLLK